MTLKFLFLQLPQSLINSLRAIMFLMLIMMSTALYAMEKSITLTSPDKKTKTLIQINEDIKFGISYNSQNIVNPSKIFLLLQNDILLGKNPMLKSIKRSTVDKKLTPLYGKRESIKDHYNQIKLEFKNGYSIVFRAYNNGVAYRFETSLPNRIKIKNEGLELQFAEDFPVFAGLTGGFQTPYEFLYEHKKISEIPNSQLIHLPFVAEAANGVKIAFTEADLYDYAGLYFKSDKSGKLISSMPPLPLKTKRGGWMNFNDVVIESADYIAETKGTRSFPWRIFSIASNDVELLDNDLVYQLSESANPGSDFSWVKPGKVAWDWWNNTNLTGVSFKSGVNTETYKYFIDFAAANNIQYVNLDEGWSEQFDLLKMKPNVNMDEIMAYAKKKNVGIILWCVWRTLGDQLEPAMNMFEKWGIAGLKVDFMERDDQHMVNYYERIAKEAAKRKLIVNFHGAYKPTGMNRKYPNVINHEAVRGLEWNKFDSVGTTPKHAATIPFIRMIAGYMDYTPGAMRNAAQGNYKTIGTQPMSQGTRCQQLSMYVLYEAPLSMLSDAPTLYEKEPLILDFLAKVPTTWDDTKALDGKIGEFAAIARRKGSEWFVGALTNWTPRQQEIDLSFLGPGEFEAEIYEDGVNAGRDGTDYRKKTQRVNQNTKLKLELASGGGAAIRFSKVK